MKKGTIEKFSLSTISATVKALSDVGAARSVLPFAVGAVLDVSGTIQRVVKRGGERCKLVIEPGDVPGFVVFAVGCYDAKTIKARKIRKGSAVTVRGRLASFGGRAVCLIDCELMPEGEVASSCNTKKESSFPKN